MSSPTDAEANDAGGTLYGVEEQEHRVAPGEISEFEILNQPKRNCFRYCC